MAHAIFRDFALRAAAAILAGGLIGGSLGLASAQDKTSGWLDEECAKTCAANGYDAEFCGDVCWVQDPAKVAEADNLDWKCVGACGERGGTARTCGASCRRY
jgi:hypothetical protein